MPGRAIDDDVAHELDRVRAAGIGQAILVDLTRPDVGVPVVRMVVPGLEGWTDKVDASVPGARRRALREAMRDAGRRLPRADAGPRRGPSRARRRVPPARRSRRRPARRAPPAACHRPRRRRVRAGARRVAQGDPVRPLRGRARLRRREHGRPPRRRARRRSGCAASGTCTAPTRTALLEDDDEVAVAHADAEHGFRALSDAMVDVRATLDAAVAAGVVDGATAASLLAQGQGDVLCRARARRRARSAATRSTSGCVPGCRTAGCSASATTRSRSCGAIRTRPRGGRRAGSPDVDAAADALLGGCAPLGGARRGRPPARPRRPTRRSRRCSTRCASTRTAYGRLADRSPAHRAGAERCRDGRRGRRLALGAPGRARGGAAGTVACSSPKTWTTWLEERDLEPGRPPEVARRLAVLRWARDAHRDAVAGEMALAVRSDEAYAQLAAPRRAQARRARIASVRSRDPRRRASSSGGTSASGSDRRCPSRSTPGRRRTAGAGDRPRAGASSEWWFQRRADGESASVS